MPPPYLLDTTVLLHWARNSPQAQAIDADFQLSASSMRPLICEVSLGEMLAFSLGRNRGAQKLKRLAEIERQVVVVDISDHRVRQAYAELSTLARSSGWSLFHGKNDLWVGAAARCGGASVDHGYRLLASTRQTGMENHRAGRHDRASSRVTGPSWKRAKGPTDWGVHTRAADRQWRIESRRSSSIAAVSALTHASLHNMKAASPVADAGDPGAGM